MFVYMTDLSQDERSNRRKTPKERRGAVREHKQVNKTTARVPLARIPHAPLEKRSKREENHLIFSLKPAGFGGKQCPEVVGMVSRGFHAVFFGIS